jgi:hypothetical protein
MELTLKENYTILHINAKKGLVNHANSAFSTGLVSVVLAELLLLRKIGVKGEYLVLKDALHTGDEVLDYVLDLLDASDNDYTVKVWLERLTAKDREKGLLNVLFSNMEKRGLIKLTVTYKFLIFGKELTYQIIDPTIKSEIENRFRQSLLVKDASITEDDSILIILLDRCRLFKLFIADANDRRTAGKRVKELMAIPVPGDQNLFKALQVALKEKYTVVVKTA